MTATWSAIDRASSWSWVTSSVVTPASESNCATALRVEARRPGVQCAERFVEQHQHRAAGERPGECHPLLLAPGQFVGSALRVRLVERHRLEQFGHPWHGSRRAARQTVCDVLADGQVGEQRTVLCDVADVAPVGRNRCTCARHLSSRDGNRSRIGRFESRDDSQQCGLAASGGADDGRERARASGSGRRRRARGDRRTTSRGRTAPRIGAHRAAARVACRYSTSVIGTASSTSSSA